MFSRPLQKLAGLWRGRKKASVDRLFQTLATLDGVARADFMFQNPVLFSLQAWREVEHRLPEFEAGASARVREAKAIRDSVLQAVEADLLQYPVGLGPIERLLTRVDQGDVSLEAAEQLARNPDITDLLSSIYVGRLSYFAEQESVRGVWREAIKLHKLTLSAVGAHNHKTDSESFEMRVRSSLAWIAIVKCAAIDVPDGRLYRDALKRGEALLLEAEEHADRALRSEILFRLGTLHLDPYVTGRQFQILAGGRLDQQATLNYLDDIARWQRRVVDEIDIRTIRLQQDKLMMPEPTISFTTAIDLLTEASKDQAGIMRARTLKALAEAMFYLGYAGGQFDRDKVVRTAEEAIALFDPMRHHSEISSLKEMRRSLGERAAEAPTASTTTPVEDASMEFVGRILSLPVDEIARKERDPVNLVNLLRTTARQADAPERRMQIWEKAYQISRHLGGSLEHLREQVLKDGLSLFEDSYNRDGIKDRDSNNVRLVESASLVKERAQTELWTQQEYFDAVVALAVLATRTGQEEDALHLLSNLAGVPSSTANAREPLITYLRSVLIVGAAVNALAKNSFGAAARFYLLAIPQLLAVGLTATALETLRKSLDMVGRLQPEDIWEIFALVALLALPLQEALGQPGMETIQEYCWSLVRLMQTLARETPVRMQLSEIAPLLVLTSQVAKGLQFAAALAAGTRYAWQDDLEGRALLDRIHVLSDNLPPEARGPTIDAVNDEVLLSSYIAPGERAGGADEEQVLTNLRRSYDEHVTRKLVGNHPPVDAALQSPDDSLQRVLQAPADLQEQIGERTVLLIYSLGIDPSGHMVLNFSLLTRESIWVDGGSVVIGLPELDQKSTPIPGHQLRYVPHFLATRSTQITNLLGAVVARTRAAIQENPQSRDSVSRNGKEILQSLSGKLIDPSLRRKLDELRGIGKDHLCIVPEGALHFLPFHLLEFHGEPLAASWAVTYLPNLKLLTPGLAIAPRLGEGELCAFGIDFTAPYDPAMQPIREVQNEVQEIAELYGARAVLNGAATRSALLEALRTSKRMHIATHGRHQVDAPLFQCIYVADGVRYSPVYAYEILGLDLRNVDLLTLSACETALGRFDLGDNLRGLPASFFIRGVKTIVGTLWNVESRAAAYFFTSFYRALRCGPSKLTAFVDAQRRTREKFPEYRDWGCFYFAGRID